MPAQDMQTFVAELEQRGWLKRIKAEVDPILEIAEITDRVVKAGGPALLFEKVKGSRIPVLINTFGTKERMCLALGAKSYDEVAERVQVLIKPEVPTTLMEKLKKLPQLIQIASLPPKIVRRGMCQEVVHTDDANLLDLPIIKCWPHDGDPTAGDPRGRFPLASAVAMPTESVGKWERGKVGRGGHSTANQGGGATSAAAWTAHPDTTQSRIGANAPAVPTFPPSHLPTSLTPGRYITLGGVFTKNPETGDRNIGMYRVQIFGPKLAAMHWHIHHDGARHFRRYQERGERMPIAIALGGPAILPYAATCPLPPGIDECLFGGFLNGGAIELVPCVSQPNLEVPANAEIVIEGYIDPADPPIIEGPFGDHTGFYSLPDYFPQLHVTAITHRKNPLYLTTIVGKPPQEDFQLGKATERIFLPLLKMLIPDIIDYNLPMFGCFHNCVFVKIRKEYPYQARRVMSSIWGAGQMAFSKIIVVVDEHVDVHDEQQVLFQLCSNVDPRRDCVILDGPLDILDHAAPFMGAGSKIGFDATQKIPGEGAVRYWPDELEMSAELREQVSRRWREYGL